MSRVFFFILTFLLSVTEACAVRLDYAELKGVAFVGLSGAIGTQDAERAISSLLTALEKNRGANKVVGLSLDSPGGLIVEAEKIGDFVRTAKIPVIVTQQSTCASACFLIFMNAPSKFVVHGARIGVHSISINGEEDANTSLGTVRMARLAREAGVPQSVIGKMVTANPGQMNYLSDNELKQMGATFVDDDDSPVETRPSAAAPSGAPAAPTVASPPTSGSVSLKPPGAPLPLQPESDPAEEERRATLRAEQDRNFVAYWKQIVGWSKGQHGGALASERRCNKGDCATVVAYFDRQQRYVEAWKYDEPPKGSGMKLVCRQMPEASRLSCRDWYDEHEFVISYTHQIGEDNVSYGDGLLDIFK